MKNSLIYAIIIILLTASCKEKERQTYTKTSKPIAVEVNCYNVPYDSNAKPKMVLALKPEKLSTSKPEIVFNNKNLTVARESKVLSNNNPKIIKLGQDSFSYPKSLPAYGNPFIAEIPEMVAAKDPHIKDQNPYNFSSFNKLQGLKHDVVKCILQDKYGNLWIGTNGGGVSKFDGKYFTHYAEKEGLSSNRIFCMLQDKDDNIWFGTNGGGVTKYDGRYFTHFTEKEGLSNNSVYSIIQDKSGCLWFGTYGGGVIKYDGTTFTNYTTKEGLSNNYVICMLQDIDGNYWFGTEGGGVTKYDGKYFTHFTTKEGLNSNRILSIYQDFSGKLWFGTYGEGVSKFDGKHFTHITEKEGLKSNFINSIFCDHNGIFWFGTDEGLVKYDGKYFYNFSEKEGLSNNKVFCITEDKNKNLWFGSSGGGVSKYDGKRFSLFTEKEGLCNSRIYSILQDRYGIYWFGTSNGLIRFDGKFFYNLNKKQGFSGNRIYCITEDTKGNLWIGDEFLGLIMYDGKTFIHYTEKQGLLNNTVISMIIDHQGSLWIGTALGLSKYDGKYFTNYTKKEGLSGNRINSIYEDNNHILWIATDDGGVTSYDGQKFTHITKKEGLFTNRIYCITQDSRGDKWFGSDGGGVVKYDGRYLTHFNEKNGLSNNTVLSILQDKNENLWFGTRFGLNKLSKQNLAYLSTFKALTQDHNRENNNKLHDVLFKSYTYEDGFFGIGCNMGAIYEDRKSNIWIGANDKLTTYHPLGDEVDTTSINIQLINIKLFNENINWVNLEQKKDSSIILGNGVIVSDFNFDGTTKWYGLPINLSLKYSNNFISFNFIGITQKQSNKVKYQYKLDGLDKNWSTPTLQNEVSFGNLLHGTYTFRVKGMNSDGYLSKEFVYTFTIRPPWWKTWWFKAFVLSFIIACWISFYQWRIVSLKRQKKQLKHLVKEKTKEVIKQKEELQIINEALIKQKEEILAQKNELELANATKDKFFSIIAHDLRNPFNNIMGFSNLLIENIEEMDYEESLEFAKTIKQSSSVAYELLENLLNWSKSQTGKINFNPENLDLKELVDANLLLLKNAADRKGIQLVSNLNGNLNVYADKNMVLTILRNLITNAIKFSNKGDKIVLDFINIDQKIEIHVSDTGVGIDEKVIGKLFKVDEKIKTEGTANEPGTGLGLILCKEFVNLHNGKIWVESKVGAGSRFSFTLPKADGL